LEEMKAQGKQSIFTVISLVVVFFIFYTFLKKDNQESYVERILSNRVRIDDFMRNSADSPFNNSSEKYNGFDYFDPDPAYRVVGHFKPLDPQVTIKLATSDGNSEDYLKFGHVSFELNNRSHELLVLKLVDEEIDEYFIPFADSSSGDETYGGGRYLEVDPLTNNTVVLDFNLSYNPYCAYSELYVCPLPPVSNYLAIEINAGEKNYH